LSEKKRWLVEPKPMTDGEALRAFLLLIVLPFLLALAMVLILGVEVSLIISIVGLGVFFIFMLFWAVERLR